METRYSYLVKIILDDAVLRKLQKTGSFVYIPDTKATSGFICKKHSEYIEELLGTNIVFNSKPCFFRQMLRYLSERFPTEFPMFSTIRLNL